jgi:integrase
MRAQRRAVGCGRYDKRRGTWNYLFYDHGKRRSQRIGTKKDYPTKAAAWNAVGPVESKPEAGHALTISTLVEQYRAEKMPTRTDTRRTYNAWLRNHILPKWGACDLTAVQARPVELWLASLALAPKSRVHIRGTLSILWDFAMWRGDVPTQRNPMELVTVKDATKRKQKPRSLTVAEFQKFIVHLGEPFRTMALLCVCFGLRISEALAQVERCGLVERQAMRRTRHRGTAS